MNGKRPKKGSKKWVRMNGQVVLLQEQEGEDDVDDDEGGEKEERGGDLTGTRQAF